LTIDDILWLLDIKATVSLKHWNFQNTFMNVGV
jgi:hypothetical protein